MTDKINPIVRESIVKACHQNGQGDDIAKKMVAWIEANHSRDMDFQEHEQFAQVVVNSIKLRGEDGY